MASMKATRLATASVVPAGRLITPAKPFVGARQPAAARSAVRVRVAEAEAEAPAADGEDLDFAFSFSDAKKGNEYSANDVEAAMRWYLDGEGSAPSADGEFVANTMGSEDASFFDDIDNNEAYEADEYIAAGIPEAAPKKRGRGRREDGAQEEGDDLEQAKALDKVKALEDRMVLEAALEEEFGDATSNDLLAESGAPKTAVWEWLTDFESTDQEPNLEEARQVSTNSSSGPQLSEKQLANDISQAASKPEVMDNPQVQYYLELFAEPLDEETLTAMDTPPETSVITSSITDEELARLDALLEQPLPIYQAEELEDFKTVPLLMDEPELQKSVVEKYIKQLRAALASPGASMDEVKTLFGDEPLIIEELEVTAGTAEEVEADRKEYQQLVTAPEPKGEDRAAINAMAAQSDDMAFEIEDTSDEPADDDDGGMARELAALQAIEGWEEADIPTSMQAIEEIEQYLRSADTFVADDEARRIATAEAVARGELSPDALAGELEDVPDVMDEMLADGFMLDDGTEDASQVEEDDGQVWEERIIELTRVTKVVKGGKIMGFRCVAIVGNKNGLVGVGCQAGREVAVAVKRTLIDAKKKLIRVPLVGAGTIPHRTEAKFCAAKVVCVPASDGTGCIAGGSVRSVLELAGVQNVLAKRIGSRSALNSARATIKALTQLQSLYDVSEKRGVPMERLLLPAKRV